jgi:hypothetical protein
MWRFTVIWSQLTFDLSRENHFVLGEDLLNFSFNLGCRISGQDLIDPRLQQDVNFISVCVSSSLTVQLPLSAGRILMSRMSFRDFTALNSFLLILGISGLVFCNFDLTCHLNSIPEVGGSFGITGLVICNYMETPLSRRCRQLKSVCVPCIHI